jgi:hypothetical protein
MRTVGGVCADAAVAIAEAMASEAINETNFGMMSLPDLVVRESNTSPSAVFLGLPGSVIPGRDEVTNYGAQLRT